jgi:hypothetical protein
MFLNEIVKEIKISFEENDLKVRARILFDPELSSFPYSWEISHHYKPSETAGGAYYPSSTNGATAEEAEAKLMMYLAGFTDIGLEENELF